MKLQEISRIIECPVVTPFGCDKDDLAEPIVDRRIALDSPLQGELSS